MKTIVLFAFIILSFGLQAQNPWMPTNSPASARYDDISFVSPDTGWAVSSGSSFGPSIFNTTNGGLSWAHQKTSPGTYMRSVEFANKRIGFAGALEYSGHGIFFKTNDGGATWTDISGVISGTSRGICGICCVDSNVVYAVGVYSSPAYIMKTTDGGNNWTQIDMAVYASCLVDVQFTDANNGYVTGQSNISSEGAVILKTTDGGSTWTKVFTSNVAGEYLWKIQDLDGQNWFASIEAAVGPTVPTQNVFLKSTDGGNTWVSKPVAVSKYFQGIGFMTPMRGWIGSVNLYETNDGGDTWIEVAAEDGTHEFDRFQKVNATTAYFSSTTVCKLDNTVSVKNSGKTVEKKKWLSVSPNPAKDEIAYQLDLPNKTMYVARLFNSKGEIIWQETNQREKGAYKLTIDKKLVPGIYYVYVMFNEGVECVKVLVQ